MSVEEQLGKEQLQDMKADGMLDGGLQHVATREYRLQCNWKVFADNYLVCLQSVAWPGAVSEEFLVKKILQAQALSSIFAFSWLLPAVQFVGA